ncbi:MAG: type I-B CRISPR-associated protein Cas5 [Bacilli bacterium]|nr:type I-B CRISPR-associated protein Cas5 [Bacilli bacterium]
MKGVVFTVTGSYARFRRPYTTTSALTFTLIHPIALKGLIGSLLGIDYNDLYNYTNDLRIGIQVLNPVYKDMQSFNLNAITGNNNARNFQSTVEFLRDVKYRVFVSGDESKLKQVENVLSDNSFRFTPYLGNSEHIAKVRYEGSYNLLKSKENLCHSVLPKDNIIIDVHDQLDIYLDRIPVQNDISREYTKYQYVGYTVNNQVLKTTGNPDIYHIGDYYVYLF